MTAFDPAAYIAACEAAGARLLRITILGKPHFHNRVSSVDRDLQRGSRNSRSRLCA